MKLVYNILLTYKIDKYIIYIIINNIYLTNQKNNIS